MEKKLDSSTSTTFKHLQGSSNQNYSSKAKDDGGREERICLRVEVLFMIFCRPFCTGKEVIMEEINPPRVSRKNDGTHVNSLAGPKRKSRYSVDDGGDRIECSGRYCRSCTAALIADCVAVCCCPCAVVNFLALAFVKVPWMIGRKCLGLGKKKKLESQRKCKRCEGGDSVVERDGTARKWRINEGIMSEISSSELADEEAIDCVSARYEAERVWLELYQVGHLGFGRHSSSG